VSGATPERRRDAVRPGAYGAAVRRLRPLSEQECYARCYGWRSEDAVRIVKVVPRWHAELDVSGELVRSQFAERLSARAPEAA
jgi:hypothetical protein